MGKYRRKMLCYAGFVLMAPSCAFHTALPAYHISRNEDVRSGNPLLCDTRVSNRACSRTWPASRSVIEVGGLYVTTTRRSHLKELESGLISEESRTDALYRLADVEAYSALWGITLRYRSTLNTYRIEGYRESGELAGYVTAFYIGDYLHLDKLQIQRKESAYEPGAPNAPAPGTRDLPWTEKSSNIFQLGAVLGCAAMRYAWDRGARRVELLAIRENERQHSRLVRYYRIGGFRAIREVGEDLGSLQDRLVWGAEGTLMATTIEEFMKRWAPEMLSRPLPESAVAEKL